MKLDRKKFNLARARACKGSGDLVAEGIPRGTLCRALSGSSIRPESIGRIAKALGCDVEDIIEEEGR